MPYLRSLLLAVFALLIVACAHDSIEPRRAQPIVIVISLDGFHPDYLKRGLTPTLQSLIDNGAHPPWMTPSFPSKTFPNHYTIVTGLLPDHHGIVDNSMLDADLGRFSLGNRAAVGDARWWGGEPIWITARRHGLNAATLFWPGSEAPILGHHPHDWLPYDAAMSIDQRLQRLFEWLDRPVQDRPHLLLGYLEHVDSAGHAHGPHSTEVDAALVEVDQAIARLVEGLRQRGLVDQVNLIIVSDHGMAELLPERTLYLEDIVDPAWIEIASLSEISLIQPRRGHRRKAESALLAEREGITCHRKNELPAQWRYGQHPRVTDIVCLLDEGWRIVRRESFNPWQRRVNSNRGGHGFDPASAPMRALFIGHGPAFKRGYAAQPFANVHVYALLARLLDIEPAPNDGDAQVTAPMLRSPLH